MATILSQFSAARMVNQYVDMFYRPAARQGERYLEHDGDGAKVVAAWKARVRAAWDGVTVRRLDEPRRALDYGEATRVEVAVGLNGLASRRRRGRARALARPARRPSRTHEFVVDEALAQTHEQRFVLDLKPELCGRLDYRIRVYPRHALLTHPFELGLMRWL